MNWNWDHLRFFLALAERGTLSEAARDLEVSHTTVQRRLRAFESALHTTLFDQLSNGYRLTGEGERLYAEAIKMRRAMQALSLDIAGSDDRIAGSVVITAPDTLGLHVLPALLVELADRHPDLELRLDVDNAMSDIANRDVDIALRTCRTPPDELIGRHVADVGFMPCCSRDYAERHALSGFPHEPDRHRFVRLDGRYRHLPFHGWLEGLIERRSAGTVVGAFNYAYELCLAGAGITVLPSYLVAQDARLVALRGAPPMASNPLWMLCPSALRDSARIRTVRHFLSERLPARIDAGRA